MAQNIIKKDHVQNKTFNYSKGEVNLDFTLRVDIKTQLKDFLEILKVSIKDVEEEIKNIK